MATPSEMSDETIATNVTHGDIDAYGELMARYEAKLLRYVTYLIRNQTTAADVVQDTFIKAYQNLQGFNPKYKFSSWIYRIAHNEAMNAIKKSRHISDDDIDELPEIGYDQKLGDLVDAKLLKNRVQHCLAELNPKYREVIQLIYFERMKYEEVSDVLHIPTSTVGVWLSRAKSELRVLCERKGVTR